ncbi:MAG: patatin-like phospholipase family protein [Myxococcota bacterium]|nr:patatin-like phospholipase family protein [Myxococcota bacterium]
MKHLFGLALAGGGARGAYAAGVMRYLFTELPKTLGFTPWPQLVSGTSVGALNGYFAATHSIDEVRRMTEIWTNLKVEDIFEMYGSTAFRTIRHLFRVGRHGYLLDQTPLRTLIEREAARRSLRKSIAQGKCKAYFVSATVLNSGDGTLFVETGDPTFTIPPLPKGKVVYTKIYPEHLIASAAIPIIFPPESIDGVYYIDGGVRQNAPLHPILYGGAERILVIGTRKPKEITPNVDLTPSLSLIAGKTLNALTLDPIERDTNRAQLVNSIIDWGIQKYGAEFGESLYAELGLRTTKIMQIHPTKDLGQLAGTVYSPQKVDAKANVKWLLNTISNQGKDNKESDLLSQLLFDGSFTREVEQIGFHDAEAMREELHAFFTEA